MIYYWDSSTERFFMLFTYPKSMQDDLSLEPLRILSRAVKEEFKRRRASSRLISGIREAGKIRRGQRKPSRVFEFRPADVRRIRRKLGKSQTDFAMMIGVSAGTLRNWEQGRKVPDGPVRALLKVAAKNPKAVAEALSA